MILHRASTAGGQCWGYTLCIHAVDTHCVCCGVFCGYTLCMLWCGVVYAVVYAMVHAADMENEPGKLGTARVNILGSGKFLV